MTPLLWIITAIVLGSWYVLPKWYARRKRDAETRIRERAMCRRIAKENKNHG